MSFFSQQCSLKSVNFNVWFSVRLGCCWLHVCRIHQFNQAFLCPAARVLLCVRVVCLRGVFSVRSSSKMKRGKKTEEAAAADGENDSGSGLCQTCRFVSLFRFENFWNIFNPLRQLLQRNQRRLRNPRPPFCTRTHPTKWPAKMAAAPTWRLRRGTWTGWGRGWRKGAWM